MDPGLTSCLRSELHCRNEASEKPQQELKKSGNRLASQMKQSGLRCLRSCKTDSSCIVCSIQRVFCMYAAGGGFQLTPRPLSFNKDICLPPRDHRSAPTSPPNAHVSRWRLLRRTDERAFTDGLDVHLPPRSPAKSHSVYPLASLSHSHRSVNLSPSFQDPTQFLPSLSVLG